MTKKFLTFNPKYKDGVHFFLSPRDIEKRIWGEPVGGKPPPSSQVRLQTNQAIRKHQGNAK